MLKFPSLPNYDIIAMEREERNNNILQYFYKMVHFLQDFEQANAESHAVISSATEPRLPPEWNNSQDVYALQYLHDETQQLCLVKAISLEDELLVSAVVCD